MGIKLGGTRHRRSYADYKPPSKRKKKKPIDPFLIIFVILLVGGGVWGYFNLDVLRGLITEQTQGWVEMGSDVQIGPTPTPTPQPEQFAGLALEAYKAGNIDKALELYTQAADYAPNSVEYHFQVARLLLFKSALMTGDKHAETLEQAAEASNKAILANPERPEGFAIHGKVLDWQGQTDQALAEVSRSLEGHQDFALGHSYMAEVLVDLQRWDQAQEAIDLARSLDSKNPDILRDYAYVLESLGDYASAATQYEASLAIEPNQPYVMVALARIYRTLGRHNDALDQLFAVDTLAPKNALVQFEVGLTYETYIGDPTSAIKYYEQATEADPSYAAPWIRLGTIYYIGNSFRESIPYFEEAIKLGVTDRPNLYIQLGLAYANQGRCNDAVDSFQKAEALVQPDDTDSQEQIAEGYRQCPSVTPTPGGPTLTPRPSLTSTKQS